MLGKHFAQEFSIDPENSTDLPPQQLIGKLRAFQHIGQYQYAFKDELTDEILVAFLVFSARFLMVI